MAYDKPQVPEPTAHYPGHKHEDMKRLVDENYNSGQVDQVIDAWKSIGRQFNELSVDFNILVNGSEAGWTGRAAQGVRTALGKVGEFADKSGDAFMNTGSSVESQRDAASQAKQNMPEPVEYNPLKTFKEATTSWNPIDRLTLPFDMMEQREKSAGAKEQAVHVMQERDGAMRAATSTMPTYESTPIVTQDQGTTTSSSSTYSKSTNSMNPNMQFGNGMTGNGNTNTSWTAPPTNQPPLTPPPSSYIPPKPPPQVPIGHLPPGFRPNPNDPRNNPRGAPGGPGGGRGGGMGGPGGAGMGRGPAGFGPSNPGGAAGTMQSHGPESARGANSAAGRAGTPAAGGMGGGGAGQGQGEEDKEHKSTYLLPSDEYFDDDRMVAPPVIGG